MTEDELDLEAIKRTVRDGMSHDCPYCDTKAASWMSGAQSIKSQMRRYQLHMYEHLQWLILRLVERVRELENKLTHDNNEAP